MRFSYTYRDGNGSQKKGVVEALNRSDAFGILAKEHIRPLSLQEGGDGGSRGNSRKNLILWCAIAVLVLGGGVALFFLLRGNDEKSPKESVKTHSANLTNTRPPRASAPKTASPPAEPVSKKDDGQPQIGTTSGTTPEAPKKALTPEDEGYVSPDPTFAERYKRFKEEQAKLPFKHMSELEIYRIISTMPGETILPSALPPSFEKDFVEHLNDPIVINDDDSDEVKQDKQTMIAVKAKLKELMDKGESIREIMESEQEHLVKVMTMRDNLFAELRKIEESATSLQEVEDFVNAANQMLEEYGAQNIKLPMSPARFRLLKLKGKVKK